MTEPMVAVEASTRAPLYTHCEMEIRRLNARKVLGVSHRKGLWMG